MRRRPRSLAWRWRATRRPSSFPEGITFTLDAETTDPIANLELLYRAPGVETFSVELPPFEPGRPTSRSSTRSTCARGELPPGIDVQYHWRITEADGDVVETPEQTLSWFDDRYDWTPLSGPNVTVYTYDADPAFQQAILDSAERTIASLAESYGAELEQPVRVWAYADKDDLYGALAPNSEPWIAGAAYPPLHVIMAVLPPGDYDEVARVVPHEISHQVLHQATENPFNSPPQWLDEGLAAYWQESGRDRFYSYALELAANGEVPSAAHPERHLPLRPRRRHGRLRLQPDRGDVHPRHLGRRGDVQAAGDLRRGRHLRGCGPAGPRHHASTSSIAAGGRTSSPTRSSSARPGRPGSATSGASPWATIGEGSPWRPGRSSWVSSS